MFKDVLSIGGKPGLFRMVSHAKNYIIVESLIDGKRTVVSKRKNIASTGYRDVWQLGRKAAE